MDDAPERYLSIMDAAGVDVTCLNCVFYGDARRGNDAVAEAVALHPDRFVGAAFVTPHYPEEAVVELDRAFGELNMKFVKVYPDYAMKLPEDPSYGPILEWCSARELPVMLHSTFLFEPPNADVYKRYTGLHKRYPGIKWVIAHAGWPNPPGGQAIVDSVNDVPNMYLETCTSFSNAGTLEFIVDGVGADRILFGSDMTLMDARLQLGIIATADIPEEDKRKILGLNAINLLCLDI
jgi:predicted TIM-barrel fold metal-dependent hydrolase